jgi:cytochrome c oxidase subunit II
MSERLHSAVQPLGVHAQSIDTMWQVMLWTCGIMYLLVFGFLVLALLRKSAARTDTVPRTLTVALVGWAGLITLGLFGLTLASFMTDRALVRAAVEPQVSLRVTAHQWWWEIEYTDPDPSRRVRTANEIHLPVDAQVHISLSSNDVIHSFWVPNLHGKRDLIPGRDSEIRLQPLRTGVFLGQCAEFCGVQHAHMAIEMIVESPDAYRAWYEQQLASAPAPSDALKARGQQLFVSTACSLCHAIAGTEASATTGPDLTHVGSRRSLAAGTLPNSPDNLRRWIENPQRIKPGNHMPTAPLSPADLDALTAYLESLR